MKILLVEYNRPVAVSIKSQLKSNFSLEIVSSGNSCLLKAGKNAYNVIILDLGLPDISGLQVCKQLRSKGITTPLIVLTDNYDLQTLVSLLNAGADDYLTTPFGIEELRARLNALCRRTTMNYIEDIICVKDLTLNRTRREASRSGVRVPLRRKEFDILEYLVINRGRALSRNMIMSNVWDSSKERWNNTIDVHIKSLRDKIDRPFAMPIIKTAYGVGYMVEDEL